MIGRWGQSEPEEEVEELKGFDDFDLRLGDVMRGERATLGKSLLDVQRELKIKAAYIAAIENSDPSAFDTPGFIAGFVRSYARYLGLDPEWAFERFSEESGFETAHGMSADALPLRKGREDRPAGRPAAEAFAAPSVPFQPSEAGVFSGIEPRAIGSSMVLVALICGLGYGGYAVLQEVQRVELAPIDQAPTMSTDVASLTQNAPVAEDTSNTEAASAVTPPSADALERLYRPAALDVPVMVARDAPIASLDPDAGGLFAAGPTVAGLVPDVTSPVVANARPDITLIAVSPAYVRITTPGNSIVFEQVLEPGEEYAIPVTEETPILRTGNAASLYFRVNGELVGPAGEGAQMEELLLASTDLSAALAPANPLEDRALFDMLTELGSADVLPPGAGLTAEQGGDAVTLVATTESWVRVRDGNGAVQFEATIERGNSRAIAADVEGALLSRAGNSGDLYFQVGDLFFGPAGEPGLTATNISLTPDSIRETFPLVDGEALGLASE
ncbi:MAG: RodZ domain-containing protein [Pseudomonadota bacterium]